MTDNTIFSRIKSGILYNDLVLVVGLFIMSFGVALSVISDLGTTPISCIPNVLKYAVPLSLGTITIIFNFILIVIQYVILRGDFDHKQWLQIIVTIIFGYFIDFSLYILNPIITPKTYLSQWIICIISTFIIAFGVYLEVKSDAIVLPGEGVILAVRYKTKRDFGKIKSIFDSSNVIIGAILSILLYSSFRGIGLGTIYAGIVVGYIVRGYSLFIDRFILKK